MALEITNSLIAITAAEVSAAVLLHKFHVCHN